MLFQKLIFATLLLLPTQIVLGQKDFGSVINVHHHLFKK
jgi:hypothetical protein